MLDHLGRIEALLKRPFGGRRAKKPNSNDNPKLQLELQPREAEKPDGRAHCLLVHIIHCFDSCLTLRSFDEHVRIKKDLEYIGEYSVVQQGLVLNWQASVLSCQGTPDPNRTFESCASIHCKDLRFSSHEKFLEHIYTCDYFLDGKYFCPRCNGEESTCIPVRTVNELERKLSSCIRLAAKLCPGRERRVTGRNRRSDPLDYKKQEKELHKD